MKSGPIILIEDDVDDKEIFEHVLSEMKLTNRLVCFANCPDAMNYLLETTEQAFVIFCDVNIPAINGLAFKRLIDATPSLREKSIPFIFYSTSTDRHTVHEAYTQLTIQGFFKKPAAIEDIRLTIKTVLDPWRLCKHPNSAF